MRGAIPYERQLPSTTPCTNRLWKQPSQAWTRPILFREATKTFVRVQAAKRLAALGGSTSDMQDIPRRRPEMDAE